MSSKTEILKHLGTSKVEVSSPFDTVLREYLKTASSVVMSISKGKSGSTKEPNPYLAIKSSLSQSGAFYIESVGESFLQRVAYLQSLVDNSKVEVSPRLKGAIEAFEE